VLPFAREILPRGPTLRPPVRRGFPRLGHRSLVLIALVGNAGHAPTHRGGRRRFARLHTGSVDPAHATYPRGSVDPCPHGGRAARLLYHHVPYPRLHSEFLFRLAAGCLLRAHTPSRAPGAPALPSSPTSAGSPSPEPPDWPRVRRVRVAGCWRTPGHHRDRNPPDRQPLPAHTVIESGFGIALVARQQPPGGSSRRRVPGGSRRVAGRTLSLAGRRC